MRFSIRESTSAREPASVLNTGLPPWSRTRLRSVNTELRPRRFSVVISDSRSFLPTRAAASSKRSKTSGNAWASTLAAVRPMSVAVSSGLRSLARKKIVPVTSDCLSEAAQVILVATLAQLLFGHESRLILGLRAPFLARQDFLGTEEPHSLAVDGLVEGRQSRRSTSSPSGCACATRPRVSLWSLPASARVRCTGMSPPTERRPPRYRPALNTFTSKKLCWGWGCQRAVTISACRRLTSPGFGDRLARCRSQSSSAGVGMR